MIAMEILGVVLVAAAFFILMFARRARREDARVLRGEVKEVAFSLLTLILFASGLGAMIYGFAA